MHEPPPPQRPVMAGETKVAGSEPVRQGQVTFATMTDGMRTRRSRSRNGAGNRSPAPKRRADAGPEVGVVAEPGPTRRSASRTGITPASSIPRANASPVRLGNSGSKLNDRARRDRRVDRAGCQVKTAQVHGHPGRAMLRPTSPGKGADIERPSWCLAIVRGQGMLPAPGWPGLDARLPRGNDKQRQAGEAARRFATPRSAGRDGGADEPKMIRPPTPRRPAAGRREHVVLIGRAKKLSSATFEVQVPSDAGRGAPDRG